MTRKTWSAVAVAAVVVIAGIIAVAVLRDGDHMSDDMAGAGHSMGRMGSGGVEWDGSRMQMGAMPGVEMHSDGTMAMGDQAFIAMMVPHHQMAVEMARLELDRGTDAEAKALARRVIAAQSGEIARMRSWHRDWYGTDVPSMPMSGAMAMMGMHGDMRELESTDEPDRVFLRMMIPHHAGALMMADMVLAGEPREELAGLARGMVASQSAEIGDIQEIRARIAPPLG